MPSVQIIFKSKPLRSEVIKNSNGTTANPCALWLDSFTALRHAIYRGVELISKEHHGKWTKSKGWELSYANYTNKDASWTFECFIYWERLKRCLFLTPEGSPDLGLTKRDGYSLVSEGEYEMEQRKWWCVFRMRDSHRKIKRQRQERKAWNGMGCLLRETHGEIKAGSILSAVWLWLCDSFQ